MRSWRNLMMTHISPLVRSGPEAGDRSKTFLDTLHYSQRQLWSSLVSLGGTPRGVVCTWPVHCAVLQVGFSLHLRAPSFPPCTFCSLRNISCPIWSGAWDDWSDAQLHFCCSASLGVSWMGGACCSVHPFDDECHCRLSLRIACRLVTCVYHNLSHLWSQTRESWQFLQVGYPSLL